MHQWDRLHDALNCGTGSTYLTFSVDKKVSNAKIINKIDY